MSFNYNNCEHLDYHSDYYYINEIALLWCGVPAELIQEELKFVTYDSARDVYIHPSIRCVEKYSKIINSSINNNKLQVGRDGRGCSLDSENHVSPTRRTLTRDTLKKWISEEFPSNKPDFLFDKIERSAHPSITIESYTALKSENEALNFTLDKARTEYKKIRDELNEAKAEKQLLDATPESDFNAMRALAIMAWMLSEKSSAYKIAERPNAKAISEAMQPLIIKAFGEGSNNFKTFNRKISEALQLFDKD